MEDREVEMEKESLITIGSEECLSCEFFDPQGKRYFINKVGQCLLKKNFGKNHAGVWLANCNFPGKMEQFVYKFNLTVTDKYPSLEGILLESFKYSNEQRFKKLSFSESNLLTSVNSTVLRDMENRIHLLCPIDGFDIKNTCQFIRPDTKILNVHVGIGDDQ